MTEIPLSTALIGVGAWGRVLAEAAAQSSKISFTCCVGRSPERLAAFTRETGIEALPDMTAALEDRSIRAVVLAVPNARHLELARLAARAGKHVYIEKPIANTMTDALQVARHLHDHADETQVASHRLLRRQQVDSRFLDLVLHGVDAVVRVENASRQTGVPLEERLRRRPHLLLGEARHSQDLVLQLGQLMLEMAFHGYVSWGGPGLRPGCGSDRSAVIRNDR